jgi:hypothetical protein
MILCGRHVTSEIKLGEHLMNLEFDRVGTDHRPTHCSRRKIKNHDEERAIGYRYGQNKCFSNCFCSLK